MVFMENSLLFICHAFFQLISEAIVYSENRRRLLKMSLWLEDFISFSSAKVLLV